MTALAIAAATSVSGAPVRVNMPTANDGSGSATGISCRRSPSSGSESSWRTRKPRMSLWGLGQRIFFLHDGRTSNLERAISEHSSNGSEANGVINNFNNLGERSKQDLLNFLRSL